MVKIYSTNIIIVLIAVLPIVFSPAKCDAWEAQTIDEVIKSQENSKSQNSVSRELLVSAVEIVEAKGNGKTVIPFEAMQYKECLSGADYLNVKYNRFYLSSDKRRYRYSVAYFYLQWGEKKPETWQAQNAIMLVLMPVLSSGPYQRERYVYGDGDSAINAIIDTSVDNDEAHGIIEFMCNLTAGDHSKLGGWKRGTSKLKDISIHKFNERYGVTVHSECSGLRFEIMKNDDGKYMIMDISRYIN